MYPPVDTTFFHPAPVAPPASPYALIVSALVPYKRVDVAIDACRRAGVPLKIVGDGPERSRLERGAGAGATFLGRQTDEAIRDLYRGASAVLLPGEEDFGIVPLEAQACGRPVVALARGGALETVVPGQTGLLVKENGAPAFAEAVAQAVNTTFDSHAIRRHAERFSRERFGAEMQSLIEHTR